METPTTSPEQPIVSIGFVNRLAAPKPAREFPSHPLSHEDYVPWFDTDNNFPFNIVERSRLSTTHSRILHDKVTYTAGDGFIFEADQKDLARIEKFAANVNIHGQSLHEVFARIAMDSWTFGNAFLEVIDMGGENVFLEHKDASCCRVARPKAGQPDAILYSRDWKSHKSRKEFAPVAVPLFPEFGKVKGLPGKRSILHLKQYSPMYFYYGQIDYYSAYYSGWLDIDYHIPKYNLTRFQNQFRANGLLLIPSTGLNTEQAAALKEEFLQRMTGEGNNSKTIVSVVPEEKFAAKWIPFNDAPDGAFEALQAVANENIILAHRWHPALVLQQPGKLTNSSDIKAAFEMVMNTVIRPEQNRLCDAFAKVLRDTCGFALDRLSISNLTPVSYSGSIDPKQVLTTEEQREELGFAAS